VVLTERRGSGGLGPEGNYALVSNRGQRGQKHAAHRSKRGGGKDPGSNWKKFPLIQRRFVQQSGHPCRKKGKERDRGRKEKKKEGGGSIQNCVYMGGEGNLAKELHRGLTGDAYSFSRTGRGYGGRGGGVAAARKRKKDEGSVIKRGPLPYAARELISKISCIKRATGGGEGGQSVQTRRWRHSYSRRKKSSNTCALKNSFEHPWLRETNVELGDTGEGE